VKTAQNGAAARAGITACGTCTVSCFPFPDCCRRGGANENVVAELSPQLVTFNGNTFDLPRKARGHRRAEVEPYFLDGKIKEIADYCETDVVNTYRVWLRYELSGR
jgi:predicted PolB exonuclease-like 3'-5' exonuclease